ncbi:hypothetical protein EDB80DRAFT_900508 [Ilyonectria destructans]|nr:hypothetical protein EDB80DRAFT_900508 [Ilyonectria destructans]
MLDFVRVFGETHHVIYIHELALGLDGLIAFCVEAGMGLSSATTYDRIYTPRTIFLVHTSAIIESRLKGFAPSTAHIAFDITDCPDLFPVFEALAQFPQLKTIIPIIPSQAMTEEQIAQRKENLHQDPGLLRRMVTLMDEPSPDGEWHEETHVGWLLRNDLNGEYVREFYARDSSPRVKLLVDKPKDSRSEAGSGFEPWSLVLY